MKKTLLALAAAVFLFTSCKEMNATSYNETVVNLYNRYTTGVASDIQHIENTGMDKTKTLEAVTHLEKLTDSCITVMNGLKPTEEAKEFHQAEMNVYNLMKGEFIPLMKKMADAKGNTDAYNNLVDSYNAMTQKLDKAESDAQTAQQAFAAKLGMKVH